MKVLSLFTGIGGFDLGLTRAGMEVIGMCEIDKAAQQVLRRHFPGVPIYDDVRSIGVKTHERGTVDLICGGFPCQDLSVAGKRAGLAGERSGLWYEFHRIISELRPGWVLIENVPGLLSSHRGKDFAIILRGLVELGYGVCWRVLDSQYFGVAQRRRRVFIVASLGDGRAAEVLFEREGGGWNTPPSREKGERVAGSLDRKSTSSNRGSQGNEADFIVPALNVGSTRCDPLRSAMIAYGGNRTSGPIEVATAQNAHGGTGRSDFESETFVAYTIQQNDGGEHKRKDRPEGGMYVKETDKSLTIGSADQTVIAFSAGQSAGARSIAASEDVTPPMRGVSGSNQVPAIAWQLTGDRDNPNISTYNDVHPTLSSNPMSDRIARVTAWQNRQQSGEIRVQGETVNSMTKSWGTGGNNVPFVGVRRLTPTECERLQGFPDGWTAQQSDSQRYKQLGNAVTVSVIEWIGRRIYGS